MPYLSYMVKWSEHNLQRLSCSFFKRQLTLSLVLKMSLILTSPYTTKVLRSPTLIENPMLPYILLSASPLSSLASLVILPDSTCPCFMGHLPLTRCPSTVLPGHLTPAGNCVSTTSHCTHHCSAVPVAFTGLVAPRWISLPSA